MQRLANLVSERFEAHFRNRAAFFGFGRDQQPTPAETNRRRVLESFVKAIYTAFAFTQEDDDWEVQFAVSGSYAALQLTCMLITRAWSQD